MPWRHAPQRAGLRPSGSPARRRLGAVLCAVAAAWVSYAVYSETAAGRAVDDRVQTLQQQNDTLRAEIDQRRREIAAAQSDSWLEEEARRLGYVKPGERVFVPVAPGQSLPPDGGIDPGPPLSATTSPSPGPGALPGTSPTTGASPVPGASPTPTYIVVPSH